MIFSKSSPPDKLEYIRDIRLSPETLKKKEVGKQELVSQAKHQKHQKSQKGRKCLRVREAGWPIFAQKHFIAQNIYSSIAQNIY